ncbi:MAG: YaeQ family protein [Verrucomicrobia bacterium]|nr:YaeQ family protein [Verrucomicrobiota bacterium]
MNARYGFTFKSEEARRPLPPKLIIAQNETETVAHVALKLMAFLLFARERLQVESALHDDSIPFVPDLVQLDYEMRPALWIECGECSLNKLNKLAVKAHEAEIWVVKKNLADAEHLLHTMAREELRRNRYGVIALDPEAFNEVCGLLQPRNVVTWFRGSFEPPQMQFDLNGLWFDCGFTVLKF